VAEIVGVADDRRYSLLTGEDLGAGLLRHFGVGGGADRTATPGAEQSAVICRFTRELLQIESALMAHACLLLGEQVREFGIVI
jgi:hypothetical protein